jgi:hypothetical protein
MKKLFLLLLILGLFQSCKKETLETVPDNKAPNDFTVELTTIERYITRTYILALGREPDSLEALNAKAELVSSNLDSTSRVNFVNSIFSDPAYLPNLYEQNKINLLNNVDTAEFTFWIAIFNNILQDTSAMFQWPYIQFEVDRLTLMQNAYGEFVSGSIDIRELHKRMCNNYLYDQINMGSANFVISTFQHLINRNPTNAEQVNGITMIEGNNSIIFLQIGESKSDYLNILTDVSNYDEAQVVLLYGKYLNRQPSSYEMASGTQLFSSTNDYTSVQKVILTSNEFIGIQ